MGFKEWPSKTLRQMNTPLKTHANSSKNNAGWAGWLAGWEKLPATCLLYWHKIEITGNE